MSTPLEISAKLKAALDAEAQMRDELRQHLERLTALECYEILRTTVAFSQAHIISLICEGASPEQVRELLESFR